MQKRASINIGKARTGTIFQPAFATNLELYGDYTVLRRDMDLRSEPVFKRDAIYSFNYMNIDYDGQTMQKMLEESYRGYYLATSERLLSDTINDYTLTSSRRSLYWEIVRYYIASQEPYASFVYENYTDLPDTIPSRVLDLTHDLIKDCESDYEKITAIQKYLHNFTYNLTPGSVPEGQDFVDYFLFDKNEGYCTYFATAMAVMSRAAGLPSRYKEGYLLPEEKTGEDYYSVYGTNAHAWAEVYFEGIGWIAIEATPTSYFSTYYPTLAENVNYDDRGEGDTEEFGHDDSLSGYGADDGLEDNYYSPTAVQGAQRPTEIKPVTLLIIISVSGLVCYIFFKKILEDKRHKAMRGKDFRLATIESYKGLIDLLGFCGMPMEKYESANAYADRISKYSPLGAMTTTNSARIFSKARYSEGDISEIEASVIRQAYFSLYRNLCASSSKYKFFVHRYIKKL